MNTILIIWVLIVSASTNQNSPIISLPVADLASCQRMQKAVSNDSPRTTQCVQVKVLK